MTIYYEFPLIHYWNKIAHHFEGNENFIVADKGEYIAVNYVRAGKDTHPPVEGDDIVRASILREGRGLIFLKETGALLSRPFHKFFNLGEREDVVADFSHPHYIMEKLDGSMIRPLNLPSGTRWATKMGVTDVAMQAEEFVATRKNYQDFAAACGDEWTPLFEWCSRKQRIVVDYPEDRLVLLAMRNNFSGNYMDRKGLEALSKLWDLDLVKVVTMDWVKDFPHASSDQLQDFVRNMTGIEGFIVQFYDGHMVKIKTDEYVSLHRAKALLDNERDVVGLILDEKTDDLVPLLPQSDRARLRKFEADVWGDILRFQTGINLTLRKLQGVTRKEFALASSNMDPLVRGVVFRFFEDDNCDIEYIVELIRKNLGSRAAYAKLQSILKTASWKESNNV